MGTGVTSCQLCTIKLRLWHSRNLWCGVQNPFGWKRTSGPLLEKQKVLHCKKVERTWTLIKTEHLPHKSLCLLNAASIIFLRHFKSQNYDLNLCLSAERNSAVLSPFICLFKGIYILVPCNDDEFQSFQIISNIYIDLINKFKANKLADVPGVPVCVYVYTWPCINGNVDEL